MKIGIILFPGSNCERDAYCAFKQFPGTKIQMIWHQEIELPKLDLIFIPGGSSYGDYLRAGAIAAHSNIIPIIIKHAHQGRLIVGIGNGFQILTESGLLPGILMRNNTRKFICKHQKILVRNSNTAFTAKYNNNDIIDLPIAHMDGCYFAHDNVVKSLQDNEQIVFQYVNNPNGSVADIAGIINDGGNVLGMMPHPERAIDPATGSTNGRTFFETLHELYTLNN